MDVDLQNDHLSHSNDTISGNSTLPSDFSSRDALRFRCPHCQKLYFSPKSDFELSKVGYRESLSEFECTSCQKSFALLNCMAEGLFETRPMVAVDSSPCPKCSFIKSKKNDECPSCGVFESKFRQVEKLENPKLYRLNRMWSQILEDFQNDQLHLSFISMAEDQSALSFASTKYADLKQIVGSDAQVDRFQKQIALRLDIQLKQQFQRELKLEQSEGELEMVRVPGTKLALNLKVLSMLAALSGTILLIINKIHPFFPYLTGIVFAATVLFYGLWFLSATGRRA